MKWNIAKKVFMTAGLFCLLPFMIPSVAFPWSQATHAYIAGG